jgi:hypothetical protein
LLVLGTAVSAAAESRGLVVEVCESEAPGREVVGAVENAAEGTWRDYANGCTGRFTLGRAE